MPPCRCICGLLTLGLWVRRLLQYFVHQKPGVWVLFELEEDVSEDRAEHQDLVEKYLVKCVLRLLLLYHQSASGQQV